MFKEQLLININPKNLLSKHTLIIFQKEKNVSEINLRNENLIKSFSDIM